MQTTRDLIVLASELCTRMQVHKMSDRRLLVTRVYIDRDPSPIIGHRCAFAIRVQNDLDLLACPLITSSMALSTISQSK